MPNPYDQSLEGLFKVYGNWNPLTYMKGADMLDQSGAYNDMQSQQLKQSNTRDQQMLPLDVAHKDLLNQEKQAGLPGLWADSNLRMDKAALSRSTLEDQLLQAQREFKGKMTKADLDEFTNIGNLYSQAGELLKGTPGMMSHARAKEILKDKYMPEFDQVPPHLLGAAIGSIGRDMMNAQPKLYSAMTQQDDKQAFIAAENEKKLAAQKEVAAFRADLQERLAKLKTSQDPKTLEAAIVQLKNAQTQETDPERKRAIGEQIQWFYERRLELDQNKAQAGGVGKLDIPAQTGLPGVQPKPVPQVGNPGPQSPAPKPPEVKSLADLQTLYPGVPAEKLRELYKKKFGVDLK